MTTTLLTLASMEFLAGIEYYSFFFSALLLIIGMLGVACCWHSVFVVFVSLELMFVASLVNFIMFAVRSMDVTGHVMSLFVLAVVAAESVIGLALLIAYYRNKGNVLVSEMSSMKE